MASTRRRRLPVGMTLILGVFTVFYVISAVRQDDTQSEGQSYLGRKLLQEVSSANTPPRPTQQLPSNVTSSSPSAGKPVEPATNCTPRSIDQFPPDFMTLTQRQHGGVIFHVFIVIYIFAGLAIVCDDYFVASLEKICNALKLQPDVAGATFMAAGSSAPELFTSVIGVFFAKSDVGLGTIVGSAVFNILFIIAICGLFSGMVIYLTWWPLFRDSICYLISVLTLVLVMNDNQVTWYESMVMILLYVLYIVLMYFNPRLGNFMIEKVAAFKEKHFPASEDHTVSEKSPLLFEKPGIERGLLVDTDLDQKKKAHQTEDKEQARNDLDWSGRFNRSHDSHLSNASVYSDTVGIKRHGSALNLHGSNHHKSSEELEQSEEVYESPFSLPESTGKRIFWAVMLPFSCLFFLSIPDCRRPGCWQRTFVLTFMLSIVWIAVMSYVMVWMVTIVGDTLGIPDSVMGLTFLAAGTSVPDAMSSLFVARDGYGDMAVSNSIGSNVFDILLCLGLPWLLQTTAVDWGSTLHIESQGLIYTVIVLLATVVFLLVSMILNGWKLNKKFGVICIGVYVVVITFSILYELNIFSDVNLPVCPRT